MLPRRLLRRLEGQGRILVEVYGSKDIGLLRNKRAEMVRLAQRAQTLTLVQVQLDAQLVCAPSPAFPQPLLKAYRQPFKEQTHQQERGRRGGRLSSGLTSFWLGDAKCQVLSLNGN